MFSKILHTLGSRLIIGLLNLVVLLLTTNILGAEIKGVLSLFILNVSIATLISGFSGGPALVYLIPRYSSRLLYLVNLVWCIISVGIFTIVIDYGGLLSQISATQFYLVALFESILATHLMMLLGKENIKWHNLTLILKTGGLVGSFAFLVYISTSSSFLTFFNAYQLSIGVSFVFSLLAIVPLLKGDQFQINWRTIRESLGQGSIVQIGNLAQMLNYRVSYYLLEWLVSPPEIALIKIGIYSAAIQISEALWEFARSVNTVQYAAIANLNERRKSIEITSKLARLNVTVTLLGIICLFLLPNSFFTLILGDDFFQVKNHFYVLSPGILALAFSGAISHFFSGTGQYHYNTKTSLITLALTIAIAIPSIHYFHSIGAALSTSIVYVAQACILTWYIVKNEGVNTKDFIPSKADFMDIRTKITALWNRRD